MFDKTVWLWRRIDGILPWPGAVADRGGAEYQGSADDAEHRRRRSARGPAKACPLMHPEIDAARLRAIARHSPASAFSWSAT